MTYTPTSYINSVADTAENNAIAAAETITADAINLIPTPVRLTDANVTVSMSTGQNIIIPNNILSANRTIRISTTGLVSRNHIKIYNYDLKGYTLSIVDDTSGDQLFKLASKGSITVFYDPVTLRFEVIESSKGNGEKSINLYDFGAIGDGVADDSDAVQAWLDSVPSTDTGVLEVPQGQFKITRMMTILNTNFNRSLKIRGDNFNMSMAINCFKYDGDGPDVDAFLTAKTTSTGVQTYAGAQLDGITGTSTLSDPRRVSITMSGTLSSFTHGTAVTITGVDMFNQNTSEVIYIYTNISAPYLFWTAATPNATLPITYTSVKYFKSISQVSIAAQAGTAGTISVGIAGATMFLVAGQWNIDMSNFVIYCNKKASRGIHFIYRQVPAGSTGNIWMNHICIYHPYNEMGGASMAYGDDTGIQVSEFYIDNCVFQGYANEITPTKYYADGFLCVYGNNAGDIIVNNCTFSYNKVGLNMYGQNGFLNLFRNCYFNGNTEVAALLNNDGRMTLDGMYGEGNKRCIIVSSGAHGGPVVLQNIFLTTICDDYYVIYLNSNATLINVYIQNFVASVRAETKVISTSTNSLYCRNNTWFVPTSTSKVPIYDSNNVHYFIFTNGSGQDYAPDKNIEIFSDTLAPLTSPTLRIDVGHIMRMFPKFTQITPQLVLGISTTPIASSARPSRFVIPITITAAMITANTYGQNSGTHWYSYLLLIPGTRINGIYARTVTPWTSSSLPADITLEVGASKDALSTTNLLLPHSIASANIKGLLDADLGVDLVRANLVQGAFVPSTAYNSIWYSVITIRATTGNTTSFTAGETRIQLMVEVFDDPSIR